MLHAFAVTNRCRKIAYFFFDGGLGVGFDGFLIVSTTAVVFRFSAAFTVINCPVPASRPIFLVAIFDFLPC